MAVSLSVTGFATPCFRALGTIVTVSSGPRGDTGDWRLKTESETFLNSREFKPHAARVRPMLVNEES